MAGITLVQQKIRTVTGNLVNTAFDTALTAGNSVFMLISYLSTDAVSSPVPQITGGAGTINLTKDTTSAATVSGINTEIWYTHNISGGQTAFRYDTDNETRLNCNASEWSGLNNAGPENSPAGNSGLLDISPVSSAVTPSSANSLVLAIGGWTADDYSSGPTNSFTRMTATGGGAAFQECAYLIRSNAASTTTGWTLTAGINWAVATTAFGGPILLTNAQRGTGFFLL